MHMLTNRAQVNPGDWVLAMGAASGVGSFGDTNCEGPGRAGHTTDRAPPNAIGLRLGAEFAWTVMTRRGPRKCGASRKNAA